MHIILLTTLKNLVSFGCGQNPTNSDLILILYFLFRRTGRAGNKGYAYTFITPEQGRYSGDIIKALELSQNSIAEDLQKLWDEYKLKQEAVCRIFFPISISKRI